MSIKHKEKIIKMRMSGCSYHEISQKYKLPKHFIIKHLELWGCDSETVLKHHGYDVQNLKANQISGLMTKIYHTRHKTFEKNKTLLKNQSKVCEHCKKKFCRTDNIPNLDFKKKRFCSRSCANKGRTLTTCATITSNCLVCLKDFYYEVKKASLKRSHCGACALLLRQFVRKTNSNPSVTLEGFVAEYSPLRDRVKSAHKTKKDLFDNRRTWQSARSGIQKNASDILKSLGRAKECFVCGYSKNVETCHIKSVASFSDEATVSEINTPSNLIGLCPNHHDEFDDGDLDVLYMEKIHRYVQNL